ncbi:MAG: cysteine hydrolase family protein [Marmoricola sp.]
MSSDHSTQALLVMDVQVGIVEQIGESAEYLETTGKAIAAARAAGVRVIHVGIGFREGHPEVSPRNRSFSAIAGTGKFGPQDPGAQPHPVVAPAPGETWVDKKRVSAFAGSDLEMILRAGGIETLVLLGIATSGIVLSTVRQAADLDFGLVVLKDACLDRDPEVHRVLTEKVFPRQADVLTVEEWVSSLS